MPSTYTITPRVDLAGFEIAVVAADGSRHTMLGFKTKAEAEAWIEQDSRRAPDKLDSWAWEARSSIWASWRNGRIGEGQRRLQHPEPALAHVTPLDTGTNSAFFLNAAYHLGQQSFSVSQVDLFISTEVLEDVQMIYLRCNV